MITVLRQSKQRVNAWALWSLLLDRTDQSCCLSSLISALKWNRYENNLWALWSLVWDRVDTINILSCLITTLREWVEKSSVITLITAYMIEWIENNLWPPWSFTQWALWSQLWDRARRKLILDHNDHCSGMEKVEDLLWALWYLLRDRVVENS